MSRDNTGTNVYHDQLTHRYVVSRSGPGIERKTSVRYGGLRTQDEAKFIADDLARQLRLHPKDKLRAFKFNREEFKTWGLKRNSLRK